MAKSYSPIIKRLFTMTIINVIAISWSLKVSGKQFTGTACEWPGEVKESLFFRGDPSPPGAGERGNLRSVSVRGCPAYLADQFLAFQKAN
jgi:hypothetical protein